MKRESHVTPLFKRYIGNGRATNATVSLFIDSSALSKPEGDHAPSETQSASRAASQQYTRPLKRNCISGAPILPSPLTVAQPRSSLTQRVGISVAG